MTARQMMLTYFLKQKNGWVSTEELIRSMQGLSEEMRYPEIAEGTAIHNSKARKMLYSDVRGINSDPDSGMIIVSGMKGYKIASSEEEVMRFGMTEKYEALRKLKNYYELCKKAGTNAQADLFGEIREMFAV